MAWLDQDRISIHTNEIQMDLYISTKDNLYFNPFYPNTSATLYDISFLFFFLLSIKEKKKTFARRPEASSLTIPGGLWECKHTATVGKLPFS